MSLAILGGFALTGAFAVETRALAGGSQDYRIAIDADLDNGVCDPVDATRSVAQDETLQVAICLFNPAEPPDAFQIHVRYDNDRLSASEVPDAAPALDDNPDANAGTTTFGGAILGENWDCTAFGTQFPTADTERSAEGDAIMTCNANVANPDTQLTTSGAMAVLTLQATGEGEAQIAFLPDVQIAGNSRTVYTCGELPTQTIICDGARIFVGEPVPEEALTPSPAAVDEGEAAQATLTAIAQVTPSTPEEATAIAASQAAAQATATAAAQQDDATPARTATAAGANSNDDDDDDDGGGTNWGVVAVVGVIAAVAVVAAGAFYLTRRSA
jgi:hypothetical protein